MNDNTAFFTKNSILKALPSDYLEQIRPLLERVDLPLGKVLYAADEPIHYVYFPEGAMVSVVAHTEEGQAAEVAVIGFEGAAGLAVVLGSKATPYENIIQMPN